MPASRESTGGSTPAPVPHDPQDQQAEPETDTPDHWDVPTPSADDADDRHEDVPDTDEAGTRRRGDPAAPPGPHPEPQEPSG